MDYDNFEIKITGISSTVEGFTGSVDVQGRLSLPLTLLCAAGEDDLFRRRIKYNDEGYLAESSDVQALGTELRRRLFGGDIWSTFQDLRNEIGDSKIKGLRICLTIFPEAALSGRVPWEFCFDDKVQQLYIGLDKHTPIVRVIPTGLVRKDITIEGRDRLRILVAVASPDNKYLAQLYDQDEDKPEEEKIDIKTRVDELFEEKLARLIEPTIIHHATLDDLEDALDKGDYDIFQFLGHGIAKKGKAYLFFEQSDHKQELVDHQQLASMLRNQVRLCLLTACNSAEHDPGDMFSGLAQRLALANIPAVIGMQVKINHQPALDFTERFYRYLGERLPIDEALVSARARVFRRDPNSWGIPVLYLQSKDGRILPNIAAAEAEKEAQAKSEQQQTTLVEPAEARPKEVDNLLEALSTMGFHGQRNTFKAFRRGSRSMAMVLSGSEDADDDGLHWLIETLRGELKRSSNKLVRLIRLTSDAFGSSEKILWREAATRCGVDLGQREGFDAEQVAQDLVGQLATHSLVFVVSYEESSSHMETLLDDFWAKIHKQVEALPVPRGTDQSMALLLIVDEEDMLAEYYHDLLVPLPPIRRITESELSRWHKENRSLLPANMQDEAVVSQILYGGPNGSGLRDTDGLVDDILENIEQFCNRVLEFIGK